MPIKYGKVHTLGKLETDGIFHGTGTVEITEKVDGANCRFWWDAALGQVRVGSRNLEWDRNDPKSFLNGLSQWVLANEATLAKACQSFPVPVMLVGEWMIPHTINYGLEAPKVLFYDVIDLTTTKAWSIENRNAVLRQVMPENWVLPQLAVLQLPSQLAMLQPYIDPELLKLRKSYLSPMVPAEGYVFKTDYHDCHAKLVSAEFKEKNADVFGQTVKGDPPEVEMAKSYCTDARFRKIYLKMYPGVNADTMAFDRVPDFKDIPQLGGRVYADIITEDIMDIQRHWKVLDFKAFQGQVMKKTKLWIESVLIGRVTVDPAFARPAPQETTA